MFAAWLGLVKQLGTLPASFMCAGEIMLMYSAAAPLSAVQLAHMNQGEFDNAGFVHVLGDAYPILMDPSLGLSTEYPW